MAKKYIILILSVIVAVSSLTSCADAGSSIDQALEEMENPASGTNSNDEEAGDSVDNGGSDSGDEDVSGPEAEEVVDTVFNEAFEPQDSGEFVINSEASVRFESGLPANVSSIVLNIELNGTHPQKSFRKIYIYVPFDENDLSYTLEQDSADIELGSSAIVTFNIPSGPFRIFFEDGPTIQWIVNDIQLIKN